MKHIKKIIPIIIFQIILLNFSISAQKVSDKDLYVSKIKSYDKMYKNGIKMLDIGTFVALNGAFAYALKSYDSYKDFQNQNTSINKSYIKMTVYTGTILMATGLAFTITGYICKRKYQNKLNNLSLSVQFNPKQKGIGIKYRF